jgi:iron complex outermembrane receptor protein/vitamin B12 transporter
MQGNGLIDSSPRALVATVALLAAILAGPGAAQPIAGGSIAGTVLDPLGARVPAAAVTLVREGTAVAHTTGDGQGQFSFSGLDSGRYQVEVEASGFEPQTGRSFFVGAGSRVAVDVLLQIGLKQEVVVTASATEESAAQVGAPITVIGRATLDDLAKPSLLEALRLVPGSQVVQAAGRGGLTSLFVRGGASNFNKVLVDGIPVNDIGGGFDYSDFTTTGVERVEALRDANSVLYGSDAMAGVISITTRRGQTRRPEASGSVDGGNLGTHREELSVGGTAQRFDYFGAYSHFATDNSVPNNAYRNNTFVGRIGWTLGSASDISASFRRATSDYGAPNAFDFYGIADDSSQSDRSTYVGLIAQSQFTPAWHGVLRLASFNDTNEYVNPSPTGTAFDPFGFGANYLGHTVTIRGANGTTATGQAILDYGGTFPQPFESQGQRRAAAAQTTFQVLPALALSAGARFEHEEGFSDSGTRSSTDRDNHGAFLEARATLHRFYANAGIGYEHNQVFESAWTPRLSAALYLREPSATASLGDTKIVFNVGRGIKAPGIAQENSSLFKLLAAAPDVSTPVSPIGPERSRSLDVGIEQGFWRGQMRLRSAYFDNEYSDLVEFLSKPALTRLGVPATVVAATSFGAYVNSSTYRAQGFETSADALLGGRLRIMASYTYLDAKVSRSFSSSALRPVENPSYPGIPIGAFSPLVGARPFRRPTHSGNLLLTYTVGSAQVSLAGYFAGKADDSTFLSDGFFGNSLLLPNRDLNHGYQKADLSASYRLAHSRLKLYFSGENVLDQHYTPAFGFPALPRTVRIGVTGTIGGDGFRRTGKED